MIEAISSPEVREKYKYDAIVIPSYGMKIREKDGSFLLSFFSHIVCKAAYELWKDKLAPGVVIEGARIFPDDPGNDGDLMKKTLEMLGVPVIAQRRDNSNTYNQLIDAKKALSDYNLGPNVLTICADLHKRRIPKLLRNYGLNIEHKFAEDILSERYPAFKIFWDELRQSPSYKRTETLEDLMAKFSIIDPKGYIPQLISWVSFPFVGADVPDVRHRRLVRGFAGKAH